MDLELLDMFCLFCFFNQHLRRAMPMLDSFLVVKGDACRARLPFGFGCVSALPYLHSVGPLRACVKVTDCCDPSSTGTLTRVKTIETCVESVLSL
jgi:hypothetical protein